MLAVAVAAGAVIALAPVTWSSTLDGATAAGQRWTEPSSTGVFGDLVVEGTLTGGGTGCHAVWARFTYDLFPAPPARVAQVCGAATAPVSLRVSIRPTTTGSITVCRGTDNTQNCAAWQSITTWPVRTTA